MNTNLDLVALAKIGAYGICIVLIFYTFFQNFTLIRNARNLPAEKLDSLQRQVRLTSWIGLALLIAAGGIDAVNRIWIEQRPVTINVQLQPDDFGIKARLLPELANSTDPVLRMQILGDEHKYEFVQGQLKADVKSDQTLSFDIHRVSDALLVASEKLKVANSQLAGTNKFGLDEPGQ